MHEMAIAADRFAILGCAYGNRRALRACLADAGDLPALSCGDLVGFCGRSDLICDLLREAFVAAIAGNHEREAAAGSALCGCGHRDAEDERLSCLAAAAQLDGLSPDDQERLAQLPERMIVRATGGSLLLAHGSPDRINEFLHETTLDRDRVRRWLDAAGAEVLAVSHSGLPWVVELGDGRLAVNCGSAGRPDHDGDPAVHYARIALSPRPEAEIRRVVYDHAAAAAELERNGIDPRFTVVLRTGVWTSGIGSLPPEERDRPARGPSFLPMEAIA
jgi:diadenosine tetraphosphatase ApaH/serine/threonine PP2A family protein phosphatase